MEAADDVVEYFLLDAHLVEEVGSLEAVFLVDELPDVGTVVIGEGLNVLVDVKVLAPVVGFVLNVPHPALLEVPTLIGPQILALGVGSHLLRVEP